MRDQATGTSPGAVRLVMNLQRFAEGDNQPEVFRIDGEEYTLEQARELLSKGKDYTKKTQELSTQRKQHEQDLALLTKYGDFIRGIDADEEAQLEISKAIDAINERRQNGQTPTQQQVNHLQKQAEATDSDDLRAMVEDMQLEREIASLEKRFGDEFVADDVIKFAIDNDIEDLEKAYKLMKFDTLSDKSKQAQQNRSVPRTQTGSNGTPSGTQPTKPSTWKEGTNAIAERMRALRDNS